MTMTFRLLVVLALLLATAASLSVVAAQDDDEPLTLTGCLLMSRRVGVYALHMEYNRIAAMGHAELPKHVGHIVTLTGDFEKQDDRLMFIVEDVTHVAATCETQASGTTPERSRRG